MRRSRSGALHAKNVEEYEQKASTSKLAEPQRKVQSQSYEAIHVNVDFGFTEVLELQTETQILKEMKKTVLMVNLGTPMTRENIQTLLQKDKSNTPTRNRFSTTDSGEQHLAFDFFTNKYSQAERFVTVHYWIINDITHPHAKIYLENFKFDALIKIVDFQSAVPQIRSIRLEFHPQQTFTYYFNPNGSKTSFDPKLQVSNLWHMIEEIIQ